MNMAEEDPDFSLLPPHVIANMLKYLDIQDFREAVLTCKSWYYASCDPRITRNLDQSIFDTDVETLDVSYIERPFNKLYIRSMAFNHFKYREFFKKFGFFIEEMYFDIPKWRLNQLYEILAYLPNLKQLRITDTNNLISTKNFWQTKRLKRLRNQILKNLRRIEVLRLRLCYNKFEGIEQILKYVNVKSLLLNEDESVQEDRETMMNYIVKGLATDWNTQNLRHLLINSIEEKDSSAFFTKMAYIDHLQLESLNLSEISPLFYNYYFKQFCKNLKGLKKLRIKSINENQLIDICNYMKFLEELELENIAALNLRYIGQLKLLQNLNLQSFIGLNMGEMLSQPLVYLSKLRLNGVTHADLVQIGTNYKNLCELIIYVLKTHDCMPIFQNLHKLRVLFLDFEETQTLNSKYIKSSDEFNITNLKELEDLNISCFVPGITRDLIDKLPKITSSNHEHINEPDDSTPDNSENSLTEEEIMERNEEYARELQEIELQEIERQHQQNINENNMEEETSAQEEAEDVENWEEVLGDCEWFINLICDT